MWRVLLYLALLAVAATGAVWLADHPETVSFTWAGREYSTSLAVGVVGIVVLAMLLSLLWSVIRFVIRAPGRIGRGSRERKRERGLSALSRGIVAVGAGDVAAARRHAGEAERLLGHQPLALLLKAQAAQAAGNREAAEQTFRRMTELPDTRILGLRGLFMEARRRGDVVSARGYAEQAARLAPAVGWANEAVLEAHSAEGDWPAAIRAVERRASLGLVDKETSRRQRAVLHAADALARQERDPDGALTSALEANRLAPDLVPAAALAGRLVARKGDLRRAAKIVETAWSRIQHPDLAATYLNLRPGDSAVDRLRRAETLARLSSWSPESRLAIARAAIEARQFAKARETLRPLLEERPTVRVCFAMADLEQAEGAAGRVREWLARAARAPRDKAWIADGVASETWAPVSPVTGRLDAFVWDTPPDVLGSPAGADDGRFLFEAEEPVAAEPVASLPGPSDRMVVPETSTSEPASTIPTAPMVEPSRDPVAEAAGSPAADVGTPSLAGVTDSPPRRSAARASGPSAREPAPVVFPVPHAPDDPGADEAEQPRSRLRFRG